MDADAASMTDGQCTLPIPVERVAFMQSLGWRLAIPHRAATGETEATGETGKPKARRTK